MITHHLPPYPPGAVGPLNHPDLDNGGGFYFTQDTPWVTDAWNRRVPPFYTHGSRVLSMEINIVLKSIVVRCLADQPEHRPTLAELQRFVERFERLPQMGQPDDWFANVYATPADVSRNILHKNQHLRKVSFECMTYSFSDSHPLIHSTRTSTPILPGRRWKLEASGMSSILLLPTP